MKLCWNILYPRLPNRRPPAFPHGIERRADYPQFSPILDDPALACEVAGMCNHSRKDQKVIEWAVRRGETGAAGEADLSRSAKAIAVFLRLAQTVESPASRRRGAPVERDLRARFFGVAQTFHPGNAPGGRVPPAGAPRRSTRKPEPGNTAFCTAPIAGRLTGAPSEKADGLW